MTSADWYYGLPRTLDNIHRVASITRDRLSLEAWRTLNDFYASRRWRADAMPTSIGDSLRLLEDGLRVLAAFHGLTHENMTRNFGWSFLDMGRRLSRAHNLAEVLLGMFGKAKGSDDESGSLLFVLELADSFITYRSRYRLAPVLPLVLDLLLADESNPRSIAFQLARADAAHRYSSAIRRGRRAHRGAAHGADAADKHPTRRRCEPWRKPSRTARVSNLQKLLSEQVDALPGLSDVIGTPLFQSRREGRQVGARTLAGRAMIFDVSHRTTYVYGKPVLQSQHLVHLTPRETPATARASP